jgi:hypothetical protein
VAEFAAGQKLTADELNRRGLMVYGRRDSNSTGSASSAAVGALRVDNVPFIAGRAVIVNISCHPNSTVNTDNFRGEIRWRAGGTAVASDPVMVNGQFYRPPVDAQVWRFVHIPSATATVSLLLCCARDSGSGTCSYYADGTRNTELWIEFANTITDTGVDA